MDDAAEYPTTPYPDFEGYVRARRGVLLRRAERLVPNRQDAQDLLQVALLRTFHSWNRIRNKTNPDAYVQQVLNSVRIDLWRGGGLRDVPTADPLDGTAPDFVPDHAEHDTLRVLVSRLPRRRRHVVFMRYWLGMSTREIATVLGLAPGTVRSTLFQTLLRLRADLERDEAGAVHSGSPTRLTKRAS
ncbi:MULTISPECIES: SigE family RNA polymerase sigma factor [unclassified Streptomyces]|uniref:SigE family RNA polymerase sigma factor n=1 Tax=unclassified Streptomyces TaxID=2593676 RepID=UPI0037F41450